MEDLKWPGVLGSLVLGEQKPRTLGTAAASSKMRGGGGGLRLLFASRGRTAAAVVCVGLGENQLPKAEAASLCICVGFLSFFGKWGCGGLLNVFAQKRGGGCGLEWQLG